MNEVFSSDILNFVLNSEKLNVIGVLLLVSFGLVGFCVYLARSIKEPMDKIAKNLEVANGLYTQSLEFYKELASGIRGDLRELRQMTDDIHDCCKEMRIMTQFQSPFSVKRDYTKGGYDEDTAYK